MSFAFRNFIANFISSLVDKKHSKTSPKVPFPTCLPMVKSDGSIFQNPNSSYSSKRYSSILWMTLSWFDGWANRQQRSPCSCWYLAISSGSELNLVCPMKYCSGSFFFFEKGLMNFLFGDFLVLISKCLITGGFSTEKRDEVQKSSLNDSWFIDYNYSSKVVKILKTYLFLLYL